MLLTRILLFSGIDLYTFFLYYVEKKNHKLSHIKLAVYKSFAWLVVLGFNASLTSKVISWRPVTHNFIMFPGFLTPVLTQLFFLKPPTTFLTCFCRGERRKYAGKQVFRIWTRREDTDEEGFWKQCGKRSKSWKIALILFTMFSILWKKKLEQYLYCRLQLL